MYTLLIVDDEKWVRQGLLLTIDWKSERIEVIGEAKDGDEALKQIEAQVPDIIITDIKMPGMDGLTLLETIRERKLKTKVIFISGYSDFDYARKALKCGAFDYILKPIQETELLDVIRNCVRELDEENKDYVHIEQMSGRIRESLPLARHRFLEKLLTAGPDYSLGDTDSKWEALGIQLDPERLRVLAVKIFDWGSKGDTAKDRSLVRYALGNIAEEVGTALGQTVACPLDNNDDADLAILHSPSLPSRSASPLSPPSRPLDSEFAGQADEERFTDEWTRLIDFADRYLDIRISVGTSRPTDRSNLPRSFEEALHACANAFYDGYGKVYPAKESKPASEPSGVYTGPNPFWETRLLHAMKLGDEKLAEQQVDELIEHLHDSRGKYSPLTIRRGLTALLRSLALKWETANPNCQTFIVPCCTLPQLKRELLTSILRCVQSGKSPGGRKRIIELALNYVQEHYTEGITMNDVAERFYFNPSYFSKMFHEEMGETFSKYVVRLRMAKSKELLKNTTMRIYEIAEQVGYNDFRHFVKTFKEYEGMTPAQYRDLGM